MIKEIENFQGVKELHNYRTILTPCCLICGNVDEYGEQLVCTLYYEPVNFNGICDRFDSKGGLMKRSYIEDEIEDLKIYLEEAYIDIQDIEWGDNFICIQTINTEIDKENLKHIADHSHFKFLQANEAGINLIYRR